jgi:two-component system alkaline phosphatase synthesis response regulator PhoP
VPRKDAEAKTAPRGRILVVEDDPAIHIALEEKLRLEGFEVDSARDGEEARERLAEGAPDLVILDLMLPRLDGLSVLRWLRKKQKDLPVLILSARGREDDKVEGLKAGADDYLAKPFGLKELIARIGVLLRRARGPAERVHIGEVEVDARERRVYRDGGEVELSKKELDILLHLIRHRGEIVSRDALLDAVWGYSDAGSARAIDYHIVNLRKKLEADPAHPRSILTRHGLGYELAGE